MYIDVNNDGFVSPSDALRVINRLNEDSHQQSQQIATAAKPIIRDASDFAATDTAFSSIDRPTALQQPDFAVVVDETNSPNRAELSATIIESLYSDLRVTKAEIEEDETDPFWET